MTYFQFLQLAAANVDVIQPLANLVEHRQSVSGLEARWNVDKQIGDLVVPRLAKLQPAQVTASAADVDELQQEAAVVELLAKQPSAKAWDGSRLKAIFQVVLPLIQLFAQ